MPIVDRLTAAATPATAQSTPAHRLATQLAAEQGGTILEFAVAAALLFTVIFAIMDCSRALYFDHYVRYSAEEAARYAMVRGATWKNVVCATTSTESCTATSADVRSLVQSITPIGDPNKVTVTTTWTGLNPGGSACSTTGINNSPGCVVQVNVAYNFNFVLPFLPKTAFTMSSTSAYVISE